MRLRFSFGLNGSVKLKEHLATRCPLEMQVGETEARIFTPGDDSSPQGPLSLVIALECPIAEPEAMTVEPSRLGMFRQGPDGERIPVMDVVCPEVDLLELRAREVAGALSLLHGGTALGIGLIIGMVPGADHRIIPESQADEALLERLGHPNAFPPAFGPYRESIIGQVALTGDLIGRLAERSGVLVYWESCFTQSPVASYRELWRALEQAFQLQGRALREAVLAFPPAVELGFDEAELTELEVLRGRASHAADRRGHREAAQVQRMVILRIGRLRALVERVLVTKAADGDATDVDELVPLPKGVDPEDFGRLVW
jgi:hypothetical protein